MRPENSWSPDRPLFPQLFRFGRSCQLPCGSQQVKKRVSLLPDLSRSSRRSHEGPTQTRWSAGRRPIPARASS
ncbi:unnamed protein product [Larinioides sclopetarius]|uniref:Uncharacterized protein n=1 Tax=Larinioides sclopetarius TaxID=280406 RepID=A0AAV2B0U2_9ARAC